MFQLCKSVITKNKQTKAEGNISGSSILEIGTNQLIRKAVGTTFLIRLLVLAHDPIERYFIVNMKSLKDENRVSKLKVTSRELLVKEIPQCKIKSGPYDKNTLKRVLRRLNKQKKRRKKESTKENCLRDFVDARVDPQVKLRCRQLPNVVEELRKAVMRQDWSEVTALVMILCHPGLKYYSSLILRACFILLFSHPNSNLTLLKNFVRLTTEYVLEEDVNKFIKILFTLRKTSLKPLESGKYIRKTGDYKVTKDPEFEKL